MHTLSDLLTYRLISLNNKINRGIPVDQISKYNLDAYGIRSTFEAFVDKFLLNDTMQSFFQAMYCKIGILIDQSLNECELSFIYKHYSFEGFYNIFDKIKKDMLVFYKLQITQYVDSISHLDSKQFNIQNVISDMKAKLIKHKFINLNTVSAYSEDENDVYLYGAITDIMEKFEQHITSLDCLNIYENIIAEDEGADIKIKDALILNALLTINKIESYLDANPLGTNTYKLFMEETIQSYFVQYAKVVSDPLTLYAFEASFADKCQKECMPRISEDFPELTDNSDASSRQSSPRDYPTKFPRLNM